MKIVEYLISSQIFVKPEITKLSPWSIKNESDNFYIIIPTVTSQLPDNVMFIQETLIVDPHSSSQYIPKLIKLSMNLSQSFATKLPNGIKIRLLIIDDIKSLSTITGSSVVKGSIQSINQEIIKSDELDIKSNKKSETDILLSAIDKKLIDNSSLNLKAEDNSVEPMINEIMLEIGEPVQVQHKKNNIKRNRTVNKKSVSTKSSEDKKK